MTVLIALILKLDTSSPERGLKALDRGVLEADPSVNFVGVPLQNLSRKHERGTPEGSLSRTYGLGFGFFWLRVLGF